jgi:hypothetical protein
MQRDGYMVSLTHMLRMPSIFRASSPRGEATCWLEAPMHMKWKLLFLNGLFWFTVGDPHMLIMPACSCGHYKYKWHLGHLVLLCCMRHGGVHAIIAIAGICHEASI